MKPIIDLVTQTLGNNCASACLSMITRRDIHEITEEFHAKYVNNEMEVFQYLTKHGVPFRRCMADERDLTEGRVYIMAVPSLNVEGGGHYIVAQFISFREGWFLMDPNDGREGRKSYSGIISKGDIVRPVVSWEPHYEFKQNDLINYWAEVDK